MMLDKQDSFFFGLLCAVQENEPAHQQSEAANTELRYTEKRRHTKKKNINIRIGCWTFPDWKHILQAGASQNGQTFFFSIPVTVLLLLRKCAVGNRPIPTGVSVCADGSLGGNTIESRNGRVLLQHHSAAQALSLAWNTRGTSANTNMLNSAHLKKAQTLE